MKKVGILFFLLVFLSLSAEARYVRKLKEPDFFIPEKNKMHQQEKLPALGKPFLNESEPKIHYQTPIYKKKYSDYIEDIKIFSRTGVMPENKELDSDLEAMNGTIFEVLPQENLSEKSKETEDFEKIADRIGNN